MIKKLPINTSPNFPHHQGFGDLSLSMEGPYRVEINHKELGKDKKTEINYNPPETGTYILAVKYGGEHVTGKSMRVLSWVVLG